MEVGFRTLHLNKRFPLRISRGVITGSDHCERLFLDNARTQCLRCHNGPLLTNQSFHRIGTEQTRDGFPEFGRFLGVQAALLDPFNCLGRFSDAQPEDCRELRFLRRDHVQ